MVRAVPIENLQNAINALARCGTQAKAAKELGVDRSTVSRWAAKGEAAGLKPVTPRPEYSNLPPSELPTSELIAHLAKESRLKKDRWKAEKWREIKIDTETPFAITWFTDLHLGDPGCDYDTLTRHLTLTAETDFAYSAFMGDATNNWPTNGRLAKKNADQSTSADQERQLIDWLLRESGQDWLFWVLGNHDTWGDGEAIMRLINSNLVPMHDWRAKFKIVCSNGREVKLNTAHDFKGHSQWNNLHALVKEAKMGEESHLLFAGHRHTAALHYEEFAERGASTWLIRAKGYKECDEYAHRGGYADQEKGHAAVTVVDPRTDNANPIVHASLDVEEGLDYLNFLRSKL